MKTLPKYILALCLLLAASGAQAGRTFLVQQDLTGDGNYDDVGENLGRFSSFTTGYTIEQFYGYIESGEFDAAAADRDSSYNTAGDKRGFWGIEGALSNNDLAKNQSHVFLVDASDGLGLFIVHNKMREGVGGTAEMQIDFSPTGQLVAIEEHDDADGRADDEYDSVVGSTDQILAQWQWGSYYSDGLAAKWDGQHLSYAEVRFTNLSNVGDQNLDYDPIGSSFEGWNLHSAGIVAQSLSLELDTPVRLTLVPLPPTAWPAVALLGVLALRKLRSRRLNQSEEIR